MRTRTPKALTNLQPRVARVSALPWGNWANIPPTLKRVAKHLQQLLVVFAKYLRRKSWDNKAIYATLSRVAPQCWLNTQSSALTRATLGSRLVNALGASLPE
jgi:hypothetical protein